MKSIKILLVGDIHFPDVKSAFAALDYKDRAYPKGLAEISAPDRLENVAREITRLRDSDASISGILLCGDLTSRGDLNGYRDCVQYLNKALQLSDSAVWTEDQIHIVPGNHDVDRSLCGITANVFEKFKPLTDAWKGPPKRMFTSDDFRHTALVANGVGVEVFSLNSCVGCGEKRNLPEKIRDALSGMLDKALCDDPKSRFELIGEQLDTPAFVETDVSKVIKGIGQVHPSRLPIVLAHHNLLPQAAPRIDLYTEAINGGLVRSRLTQCSRSVIYCHGHIHADPIDILRTPSNNGTSVVSLGVPCMTEGFDVAEIHFGIKDLPVGCTIHRYRMQNDGGILQTMVRVPLHTGELNHYLDDRMTKILQTFAYGNFIRFGDLMKQIRGKMKKLTEAVSASYLLEAEWLGAVEIHNRDDSPTQWHVRKKHP